VIVLPTVGLVLIAAQVFIWRWAPRPVTFAGGLLVGALLIPLIAWERRQARKITFGRRATEYEVLASFGKHVSRSESIDGVAPRMADMMVNSTGATSARVLLRVGTHEREIASVGDGRETETSFPVIDRGEELGSLRVSFSPSDPLDTAKEN